MAGVLLCPGDPVVEQARRDETPWRHRRPKQKWRPRHAASRIFCTNARRVEQKSTLRRRSTRRVCARPQDGEQKWPPPASARSIEYRRAPTFALVMRGSARSFPIGARRAEPEERRAIALGAWQSSGGDVPRGRRSRFTRTIRPFQRAQEALLRSAAQPHTTSPKHGIMT